MYAFICSRAFYFFMFTRYIPLYVYIVTYAPRPTLSLSLLSLTRDFCFRPLKNSIRRGRRNYIRTRARTCGGTHGLSSWLEYAMWRLYYYYYWIRLRNCRISTIEEHVKDPSGGGRAGRRWASVGNRLDNLTVQSNVVMVWYGGEGVRKASIILPISVSCNRYFSVLP